MGINFVTKQFQMETKNCLFFFTYLIRHTERTNLTLILNKLEISLKTIPTEKQC